MSATVSKTRELLLDVARQLFARMGVDNTTMNDIAKASKKGRRTLYTYFKSKDDLFEAVVEAELNKMLETLTAISSRKIPADKKLISFIYKRLNIVKTIVYRNGTLRASFFRDIWRVEKARKKFDLRETEIIQSILEEGVKEGIFDISEIDVTALIIHHALKGLEVPYIRGRLVDPETKRTIKKQNLMNLIFNGIRIKKEE